MRNRFEIVNILRDSILTTDGSNMRHEAANMIVGMDLELKSLQRANLELSKAAEEADCRQRGMESRIKDQAATIGNLRAELDRKINWIEELANENLDLQKEKKQGIVKSAKEQVVIDPEVTRLRAKLSKIHDITNEYLESAIVQKIHRETFTECADECKKQGIEESNECQGNIKMNGCISICGKRVKRTCHVGCWTVCKKAINHPGECEGYEKES